MLQLITKKPTATFVTMEPELVDGLLELNTRNRNERLTTTENYKRAMESKLWVPTNQGIGVSASGFLVDGQHRLKALQQAGYPAVLMLVVTGLPDEAVAAVDGGTNRAPRDYLKFLFNMNVSALVSALLRTSMLARDGFSQSPKKYQPQEYARHFERLGNSICEVLEIEHAGRLPASVVAALVDAHRNGYEADVLAFTTAVVTGEMLEKDNPALTLRNFIASAKGRGGANSMVERYKKTSRALQAWVEQRPLNRLYRTKSPLAVAKERMKERNTDAP